MANRYEIQRAVETVICPECKKDLTLACLILGKVECFEMHQRMHQRRIFLDKLKIIQEGMKYPSSIKFDRAEKELNELITSLDW